MTNGQNLRVIAGSFKGRTLSSPSSTKTHPMGSREKLALFNMLQSWITGARVLDVYAGSGALGIEALSRGAKEVIFVENDRRAGQIIQKNLKVVGQDSQGIVYIESVQKFIECEEFGEYFDIIIADPPYDKFLADEIQTLVPLLASEGILALSYPKVHSIELEGAELMTQRNYAAAGIALYRKI